MKFKFFTIKLKNIIIFLCVVFICFASSMFVLLNRNVSFASQPIGQKVVVIDAGHGGIDGGCVGKSTGVFESDLNLSYALTLEKMFKDVGVTCVLTRRNNKGLYDEGAKSLKKSDMQKRKQIIDNARPNAVVSIHMNSFPLASARGAQAFYKLDSKIGEDLAVCVQKQLCSTLKNTNKKAQVGDYYLVNCTDYPSVLVECGFVSNKEEEKLLQEKSYEKKLCYAIMCGVLDFFN